MVDYLNKLKQSDKKVDTLPALNPVQKPYQAKGRRAGVSAEPTGPVNHEPREKVFYAKTEEQKVSILEAVRENILFSSLDKSQMDIVVDAMFQKKYVSGESIIKQGIALYCSCILYIRGRWR